MKILSLVFALAVAAGSTGLASADPWKDESGHGRWDGRHERGDPSWHGPYRYGEHRHGRHAYKEEYEVGGCKVEREWDDGEYKEEVKCKRGWAPSIYVRPY